MSKIEESLSKYLLGEVKHMNRLTVLLVCGLIVAGGAGNSPVMAQNNPFDDMAGDVVNIDGNMAKPIKPPVAKGAARDPELAPPPEVGVNTKVPAAKEVTPAKPLVPSAQEVVTPKKTGDKTPQKTGGEPLIQAAEVPAKAKSTNRTVVKGDTLWNLAQTLLGDGSRFAEIVALNKKKYPSLEKHPELIQPGWVLEIPGKAGSSSSTTPAKTGDTTPAKGITNKDVSTIPDKTLTDSQKIAAMQKAIDTYNKSNSPKITEITDATVAKLISGKFLPGGDAEWAMMNPPRGYKWAMQNGKVVVVKQADTKVVTNDSAKKKNDNGNAVKPKDPKPADKPADKPKDPKPADKPAEQPKPADKPADKPAVDQAKAASLAEKNFNSDLKNIGIPNLINRSKEYETAIRGLGNILPNKLDESGYNDGQPQNRFLGGFSDISNKQKALLDAHKLFEEMVQTKDTDRFLGIFGNNIESASKKVKEAQDELKKAVADLKGIYTEAKGKADAAATEIAKKKAESKDAEVQYEKLKSDPSNGKELQRLAEILNNSGKDIEKLQKTVDSFKASKDLFNF